MHVARHGGLQDQEVLPQERGEDERERRDGDAPPALELGQHDGEDDHGDVGVVRELARVGGQQDPVLDHAGQVPAGRDGAVDASWPDRGRDRVCRKAEPDASVRPL